MPKTALFLIAALQMVASAQSETPDPRDLVRRSVQKDRINANRSRDYTYVQRNETRETNRQGRITKSESKTYDVMMIGDEPLRKLIAKDDKPLPDKEAHKAQDEFDKAVRRHEAKKNKPAKEDSDERAMLQDLPDAFDFSLVGEESIDGRAVWVIDAKPKPGFRGKAKRWELLTKFQGRLWIDQEELQWVRVDAETIAPVTFGWVIARLEPGAKVGFQQTRVNSELWLPSRASTKADVRLGFKSYHSDTDVAWRDYRKYRTDSRVVSTEESPANPPDLQPR